MDKIIDLIKNAQNKDGSFEIFPNCDRIFFSALMLSSLKNSKNEEIKKIKQQTTAFLLSKKRDNWVFSNYTNKNFCVYSALMEYDSSLFDGFALGKILNLLTSIEEKIGGPYYMKNDNKNIDLATNAQIAYFLLLHNVNLPNLDNLINEAIETNCFNSKFYLSEHPTILIISKLCQEKDRQKMINYILAILNENNFKNKLNKIFALLSLKNLAYNNDFLNKEIKNLKNEMENNLEKYSILELGFLIELIEKQEDNEVNYDYGEELMMNKIMKLADKRFANLKGELRVFAKQEIEKTMMKNTDRQMSLISYFMKKSFGKKGEIFSDDLIAELGLVNIFFWNAFIIYDDFWDEEGIPKILPTANLYAREFTKYFNLILPSESYLPKIFDNMMDELDAANTWETIYCRAQVVGEKIMIPSVFPDYGNCEKVFAPASAHIFGPLVLMYKLGYDLKSKEVENLINYFRNYLIAMQYNDDACDWEDDLRRGHLSTVVVMLLQDFLLTHPERTYIDMKKDLEELKSIYWYKTVGKMCQKVIKFSEKSRKSLYKMKSIENFCYLEKMITISESIAEETLLEQKKTVDFLSSYCCG